MVEPDALRAVALNCTLKHGDDASSTDVMLDLIAGEMAIYGVVTERFRVVDENVHFGVSSDEGDGDGWPRIRTAIVDAEILIIGTPIWLGHPASPCQVVLERLDAMLGETRADGRPIGWDRVAVLGVVGNEDGAHHVTAEVLQALNDVGYSVAAGGAVYWVGEAMGKVDFKDLAEIPPLVRQTASRLAANAAHLARLLRRHPYELPIDG